MYCGFIVLDLILSPIYWKKKTNVVRNCLHYLCIYWLCFVFFQLMQIEEEKRLEQEKKDRKKQKEKERKERLKAEGKLLTPKQKQDMRRAQGLLEHLKVSLNIDCLPQVPLHILLSLQDIPSFLGIGLPMDVISFHLIHILYI